MVGKEACMFIPNSELLEQSNRAGIHFLLVELDAGLTFVATAATAALPENRAGCLRNAGKVYRIVRRLLPRVQPDEAERLELHSRMAALRKGLIEAGCSPDC